MKRAARKTPMTMKERLEAAGHAVEFCECGRTVVYTKSDTGKRQELDIAAPVFVLGAANSKGMPAAIRVPVAFADHRALCPVRRKE